ncbi:aspartyl/asparaginyl beta-hydroxylase isoform X12 [Meriones unguiculatus]|uniref:aspartyl/asparaginyl beta-hydroxylase isoform X12 n=1 Tax=Meriones unguiculatus TaxID=10047 RepID=UPI00293EF09C|nr:aspartyl/asparaginyl beta-hydroxylase isoform X12 [Meriones unguiculatus]
MRKRSLKIAGEQSAVRSCFNSGALGQAGLVVHGSSREEHAGCPIPPGDTLVFFFFFFFFPFSVFYAWIEEIKMAEDKEAKHGGHRNGKRGGISGGSFFTWFMVIALLGVWTSVAVVWFDLVDYEEVLGKLGVYDADGDGDFDMDDAKVLLEGPGGLAKRKTKAKAKEPTKEELKKEREKAVPRKAEERKRGKKEEEDARKGKKKTDSDTSQKASPGSKKDREKEKANPDKSAKSKENWKKATEEKAVPSKVASRDRGDRKGRSSSGHAHIAKENNQKRKN